MESFVSPDDILHDNTYRFSTPVEKPQLMASISESGILTPLDAMHTDNGTILLSGFHRFDIAKILYFDKIPVRLADPEEIGEVFFRILLEQSAHQAFNLMEKARVVSILKKQFPDDQAMERIGPLLELPRERDKLDRLASLTDLPESVQTYLETYPVPFKQLDLLFRFHADDQNRLARMGLDLQIRSVELFDLARLCLDISKRDKLSLSEVLDQTEFQQLLDGEWTRNQKINAMKMRLRVLHSPQVTGWNAAIEDAVGAMKLESNVRVSWDHELEAPGVQLSARFESEEDFQALKSRINDPEMEKQIKKIFEII